MKLKKLWLLQKRLRVNILKAPRRELSWLYFMNQSLCNKQYTKLINMRLFLDLSNIETSWQLRIYWYYSQILITLNWKGGPLLNLRFIKFYTWPTFLRTSILCILRERLTFAFLPYKMWEVRRGNLSINPKVFNFIFLFKESIIPNNRNCFIENTQAPKTVNSLNSSKRTT